MQPDVRDEARNEIHHQYLSAEKARRLLGWSPLFTLDEGLRATARWYQTFFEGEGRDSSFEGEGRDSSGGNAESSDDHAELSDIHAESSGGER